jgi:site-specific DNA-cytosine methylase
MIRGLDLFSCSGAASEGYERAGLRMYGVDIAPQPNYRGPFLQSDALEALCILYRGGALPFGGEWLTLDDFDFAHASPPCQDYTTLKSVHGNEWPRLIGPTRDMLTITGLPYVIENVAGARTELRNPIMLCGETFGLDVIRHRYFESNMPITAPAHIAHRGRVRGWRHGEYFDGPYFAVYGEGGGKGTVAEWQAAMGITHTDDRREIAEAIPPAFAECIGWQLASMLSMEAAA